MTGSGIPDSFDAEKLAAEYQKGLADFKFAQETQRDKTLVLVSGGALAVSFAFISTLVEHGHIVRLWPLIWAWVAWSGVLILTIVGYSLSISNYNRVIQALSDGRWADARQVPKLTKIIEPLNIFVSALAVCGFVLFGHFVIGNLTRMSNEKAQGIAVVGQTTQEGVQEGRSNTRQFPSPTAVGVPDAAKK